jgi:hypothetical protein
MMIGRYKIKSEWFAYDGCHKIYLLESEQDRKDAIELDYIIMPISELIGAYEDSCSLRFINNWQLNKTYAPQFKDAKFKLTTLEAITE